MFLGLEALYKAGHPPPTAEAIDGVIITAFKCLDDDITYKSVDKVIAANSKSLASHILSPAISGSCALLSFYDSRTQLLRVACAGDSRALLERKEHDGLWSVTPLSVDLKGSNEDEAERLRREHPGEDSVVKKGRILGGLEPTRTFGDGAYKWSREKSLALREMFWAAAPKETVKSAPYVTSEPVITTTKIEPDNGDFVVMASDSLFEMLSNEEVIGLVGRWLANQAGNNQKGTGRSCFGFFCQSQEEIAYCIRTFGRQDGGGARNKRATPSTSSLALETKF